MPEPVGTLRHVGMRALDDPDAAVARVRRDRDACPAFARLPEKHLALAAQFGDPVADQPEAIGVRVIGDVDPSDRKARDLATGRVEHDRLAAREVLAHATPKVARPGVDRQGIRMDPRRPARASGRESPAAVTRLATMFAEIDPAAGRVDRDAVDRPDRLAGVEFSETGIVRTPLSVLKRIRRAS